MGICVGCVLHCPAWTVLQLLYSILQVRQYNNAFGGGLYQVQSC